MSRSVYAQRMAHLSKKIFGEVARPTSKQSMKVVKIFSEKPKHLDKEFTDWYPREREHTRLFVSLRMHGLFRDEHEDFLEEMKRARRARGKGVPQKGEGKRSKKGK